MYTTTLPSIPIFLAKLRISKPRIEIKFPNECKESPILAFELNKFEEQYIFDMFFKEGTDLSKLGKISFCEMENFPQVTCLENSFQVGVAIRAENFSDLEKIFEVANIIDTIDPKFMSFISNFLKIETEYRKDSKNSKRFDDLVVEECKPEKKPYSPRFNPNARSSLQTTVNVSDSEKELVQLLDFIQTHGIR